MRRQQRAVLLGEVAVLALDVLGDGGLVRPVLVVERRDGRQYHLNSSNKNTDQRKKSSSGTTSTQQNVNLGNHRRTKDEKQILKTPQETAARVVPRDRAGGWPAWRPARRPWRSGGDGEGKG
uniref:Secreted protein n=1 Tax=Triticum urartu TaxID=4572 RepID=A0A8R7UJB2_TRIUA